MNDAEVIAAKKPRRRKAIDRGYMVDQGDAQEVMRNQGKYIIPKAPTCVADLTSGAVLQVILSSLRCKSRLSPEDIAGRRYGFTPTAECAANVSFVAALHRHDASWNAEFAFVMIGEAAWWAVREDARASYRATGGTELNAEHEAINAAVRAAIEPRLPTYLKG